MRKHHEAVESRAMRAPDLASADRVEPGGRRVIFCADDFAQTKESVDGITSLLEAGRLSAVTCFVESPLWPDGARSLRSLRASFDAGVHFNLTQDFPDGGPSATLPFTVLAAGLHAIRRSQIESRMHRQLDRFEQALGRRPDFVDGHQHVHQLPVIRDVVTAVLLSRYPAPVPALRVTVPAEQRGFKAALIARLGGHGLLKLAQQARIMHNVDFAGIYDFSASPDYAERMALWLASVHDGGLIACHPARGEPAGGDVLASARTREFAHLSSDRFARELRSSGVRVSRFRDLTHDYGCA